MGRRDSVPSGGGSILDRHDRCNAAKVKVKSKYTS